MLTEDIRKYAKYIDLYGHNEILLYTCKKSTLVWQLLDRSLKTCHLKSRPRPFGRPQQHLCDNWIRGATQQKWAIKGRHSKMTWHINSAPPGTGITVECNPRTWDNENLSFDGLERDKEGSCELTRGKKGKIQIHWPFAVMVNQKQMRHYNFKNWVM